MSTDESPITEAAKKSRQFFNPRRDISTLIFSIGVIAIIAQLFMGGMNLRRHGGGLELIHTRNG